MSEDLSRHIEQNPPFEWHAVEYGGTTFVVRDEPEGTAELFVVSARSRNVRTFAKADAAIYEGNIVRTYFDPDLRTVEFIHDFGGKMGCHHVDEWFDEPAIRLKKLRSGSGDIIEATA